MQPVVRTEPELISRSASHEAWRADNGSVSLTWTRTGALLLVLAGHGDARFTPLIMPRYDAIVDASGQIRFLVDAWALKTYDGAFRRDLTEWSTKNRSAIVSTDVCTRSKIVSMGLAVANVVLGGFMQGHAQRESFDALVERAGFPSRAR